MTINQSSSEIKSKISASQTQIQEEAIEAGFSSRLSQAFRNARNAVVNADQAVAEYVFIGRDKNDGKFICSSGAYFDLSEKVKCFAPPGQALEGLKKVLCITGIMNDAETIAGNMQFLASIRLCGVFGIYNATQGAALDLRQAIGDQFDKGKNPAVYALSDEILRLMLNRQEISLFGHSQGALIIARALKRVRETLMQNGFTADEVKELYKKISVETIGGGAWRYPDGPSYTHIVNLRDPVPFYFGVTRHLMTRDQIEETRARLPALEGSKIERISEKVGLLRRIAILPGEGARIIKLDFGEGSMTEAHSFRAYLEQAMAFL